jgi:hypothetical protein
MSRMGIPSAAQFRNATAIKETGIVSKVKKKVNRRGGNMAIVDAALEEWEGVYAGPDVQAKMTALRHLAAACAWWLGMKAAKQSTLSQQRNLMVDALHKLALKALRTLDAGQGALATQKSKAIQRGEVSAVVDKKAKTVQFKGVGTKALAEGYGFERDTFVATGKTVAPAAGAIREKWETEHEGKWKDMTLQTYVDIYNAIPTRQKGMAEVSYLRKADRVAYLAIPTGTGFQRVDGTPLHTTTVAKRGDRIGDMWAMDRYGNLFVKDSRPMNGKTYFNHSSFTAGTEVVCAGVIVFNAGGALVYLDNNSGHYKPNGDALHAALNRLLAEGIPMAGVRVGVTTATSATPVNYKAPDFLQDPNGAPNWDAAHNAALNLPTDVSGE